MVILSHNVSQTVVDGLFDMNNLLADRVDVLVRCANAALWVSNGIRTSTTVYLLLAPHNITIEIKGSDVKKLNPDERTMALFLQRTLLSYKKKPHQHSNNTNSNDTRYNETNQQTGASSDDSANENLMQQDLRREEELLRLTERNLERPTDVNPFKPGTRPKAVRNQMRVERKLRQASARRLQKHRNQLNQHSNSNNRTRTAPNGFLCHENDTLEQRLEEVGRLGPVVRLNEEGESLAEALSLSRDGSVTTNRNGDKNDPDKPSVVTFILGNQMGYSERDEQIMSDYHGGVRSVSLGPVSLLTSQCITIAHNYLDINDHMAE